MRKWKIRFLSENKGEETVTGEYEVSVQQYMRILDTVKKLKGVR